MDLEEEGAKVLLAEDGEEAMKILKNVSPDLLLLDLLMPKLDGFGVLKQWKQKGFSFPVIMLSNLSNPEQEQQCRDLGAKDFIIKSQLDAGELWGLIQQYL